MSKVSSIEEKQISDLNARVDALETLFDEIRDALGLKDKPDLRLVPGGRGA